MSGYGYAFIPHEIYYEPSGTPLDRLQKIVQADTVNGFVTAYPLGLFGHDGCPPKIYGGFDEGFGHIHAD